MSDSVMRLAIQITGVDMLTGVLKGVRGHILRLGDDAKKVMKDYDAMVGHINAGLKSIAIGSYAMSKIRPGYQVAGDLQEAMINVKMNLMQSGQAAKDLDDQLSRVRSTAVDIQRTQPFSAQDVAEVENTLLKAGLKIRDVAGKGGAAWASTALATITGEAPGLIGESLVSIAAPFNVAGSGFGQLADFLQRVDTATVSNVPELMEGMKYVSGQAASMKISWQDTLRALGTISQQGLRGSIGGTSLNQFLLRLSGARHMAAATMKQLGLHFFDAQGKLKPLPVIIDILRKSMAKLNDQQKQVAMFRLFGSEGQRAAFALMHEGAGSWKEVNDAIEHGISLQEKMNERLKGYNASLISLKGTAKTTLAGLFDPMLKPLSEFMNMMNRVVSGMGTFFEKHRGVSAALSGGATVGAIGVGAYGIYRLLRAAGAGSRVLRGIGGFSGLAGTAVGVAEGKVVQAATGVAPVFVTNWPANFGGGSALTSMAGAAAGAGRLGRFASVAGKAGLAAGVGLGSYELATALGADKVGTWFGEKLYDLFHPKEADLLKKAEIKNNIPINITIADDRVTTTNEGLNNRVDIRVRRSRH